MLDDRATASKAEFATSPAFDGEAAELMWRHYLASDGSAAAVPARRSRFEGLPDAVITCAEIYPFRDEAIDYAQRLLRAGVGTELHVFARVPRLRFAAARLVGVAAVVRAAGRCPPPGVGRRLSVR